MYFYEIPSKILYYPFAGLFSIIGVNVIVVYPSFPQNTTKCDIYHNIGSRFKIKYLHEISPPGGVAESITELFAVLLNLMDEVGVVNIII